MILIRADANEIIGSGHVMRCLSIAHAFAKRGERVVFVTADHKGDALIKRQGFESICLDSDWTDMESENLEEVIRKHKPSLLLVDSYRVTDDYFRQLNRLVRTVYMDDLNIRTWDIDALINYNIYSQILDYSAYQDTELLMGPTFAPLRAEFKKLQDHVIKERVEDILISAGGSDPERITERLMDGVCGCFQNIKFHFIIGALNPRIDEIRGRASKNIILHINEQNMSGLMQTCDLAISAAGTTLYELCACGIPTITYTLADNQLAAAEEFSREGIMVNAGDCRGNDHFSDVVRTKIQELTVERRKSLSESMQALVDGTGADRIVLYLIVQLKPAEEEDFEDYYSVKCGQSEIFWMGYDGIPERDMMKEVFSSRLGSRPFEHSGDKRIYMVRANGQNIGMVQMTLSDEGLEFGLSIKKSEQRKGYASTAMQKAVKIARKYSDHCFAHIRDDNVGSFKACMSAGLKPTDDVEMKEFPQTGVVAYRKYVL